MNIEFDLYRPIHAPKNSEEVDLDELSYILATVLRVNRLF